VEGSVFPAKAAGSLALIPFASESEFKKPAYLKIRRQVFVG
jgi:hypothetical protein